MHLAMAQAEADPADAARLAARALLAEPRYLAARFWIGRESLRAAALLEVFFSVGRELNVGWKASLLEAAKTVSPSLSGSGSATGSRSGSRALALSFSLYAFRRNTWPATLAPIDVDADEARRITIPAASTLPATGADAFDPNC